MKETASPWVSGKRWVLIGLAVVLLITGYVMVRIVQVSGPGPDPSTIPVRPGTRSAPPDSS
jgi:hypothetical protein